MSAVQSHSLKSRLLWESRPKSKSGLPVSAAVFLRSGHFKFSFKGSFVTTNHKFSSVLSTTVPVSGSDRPVRVGQGG